MEAQINFEPAIDFVQPIINDWANHWTILPIMDGMNKKEIDLLHRLNALGSLYYFIKIVLRKHRLTEHLHKDICDSLEKDSLKEGLEIPRDHFKSTICSEGFPMWRALPFSNRDELYMRQLGYGDEYIRWMKHAHNQDVRSLLVSANIKNATKLGKRIDFHYKNNRLFTGLFPEVIPNTSDAWAVESMTHRRTQTATSAQGEGTYDFLGVGAALQSRHYDLIIEDDLVGLDALDSEIVMQSIIDYHRLVVGAFDSVPGRPDLVGDEIVVGNRWQNEDLNAYLREFEKEFKFTTHSAIGGCCSKHPYGVAIFPEEFSLGKLERIKQRLGTYFYSCQYLNSPVPPGEEKFKESNLRYFHFDRFIDRYINSDDPVYKVKIVHQVVGGKTDKDVLPSHLERVMIVDPSHAGKNGRSRHCIIIVGFSNTPARVYLLEVWAEANDYSLLVNKMYELGEKWKIKRPYVEAVGFQSFLKFHFDSLKKYRSAAGKWIFDRVEELKTDKSEDAKTKRIEGMSPVYERNEFWVCSTGTSQFMEEYRKYPHSKFKDVLDSVGYIMQLWSPGRKNKEEITAWLKKTQAYRQGSSNSATGY